jgi:hypothetical protein
MLMSHEQNVGQNCNMATALLCEFGEIRTVFANDSNTSEVISCDQNNFEERLLSVGLQSFVVPQTFNFACCFIWV